MILSAVLNDGAHGRLWELRVRVLAQLEKAPAGLKEAWLTRLAVVDGMIALEGRSLALAALAARCTRMAAGLLLLVGVEVECWAA